MSGVDLTRFTDNLIRHREQLRSELHIAPDDFVYTFLARKSVVKGINELFEAFAALAHLPNVRLLFIGPDESEGRLDELYTIYENLKPKIISLDIVKHHEKYLAVSDVLCLPSSSEGFGTIVIEAAALRVPTVGFRIVGLTDAIDDGITGTLVPFKDVTKFSRAMLELYQDKLKLADMQVMARKRVLDHFSADVVYRHQHNFYSLLLKESNIQTTS